MRCRKPGRVAFAVGSLVLLGLFAPSDAHAGRHQIAAAAGGHVHGGRAYARSQGGARHAWRTGHLQCVPFARSDSGIELSGNANVWWNEAAGRYERGNRPEPGSVLSFAANGRMRLGHVAVVSHVMNAREIDIDHANWWGPGSYGGVTRGVAVVDVSPNNDWTEVRVALGDGDFGSVYRTQGFIYDRPDHGVMVASNTQAAPLPALGPPPAQHVTETPGATGTQRISGPISLDVEVAEAPNDGGLQTSGLASLEASYRGTQPWSHGWGPRAVTDRIALGHGNHRQHAAHTFHAARPSGHRHG